MQKRKQAMEESKITRQKAQEASVDEVPGQEDEDRAALDTLLEKLRNGDTVGRRAGRARRGAENRPAVPSSLNTDGILAPDVNDTADIARDMLARLQSDGFQTFTSTLSSTGPKRQTRRRRDGTGLSMGGISELDLASDIASESLPEIPFNHGSHTTDSDSDSDSET
jgi:cytokinesis protein